MEFAARWKISGMRLEPETDPFWSGCRSGASSKRQHNLRSSKRRPVMFGGRKLKQPGPALQPCQGNRAKLRRCLSLIQLLVCEAASLFIAGIGVPSLLRSCAAMNHTLTAGSFHHLTVAGVTFSYKVQNLGFATMGALLGAAMAWAMDSPGIASTARVVRFLQPMRWKSIVYRTGSWWNYVRRLA